MEENNNKNHKPIILASQNPCNGVKYVKINQYDIKKESECVVKETVEEFVEEDGKIVLKKKKVTNKSIPRLRLVGKYRQEDIAAIKLFMDINGDQCDDPETLYPSIFWEEKSIKNRMNKTDSLKKFRKYCTYFVEREWKDEPSNPNVEGIFQYKFKSNAIKFVRDLMAWQEDMVIKNKIDIKEVPLIHLVKVPTNKKHKIIQTTFELTEDLKWKKTITKITNP